MVSLVAFHGTATEFAAFDEAWIGQGAETEPNNRLGFYLSPSVDEALDYATSSSAFPPEDFEYDPRVLAVLFKGRLGPTFSASLMDFVEGQLHDSMDGHEISDAFAAAHAAHVSSWDEEFLNPCDVFTQLRRTLQRSYDALWIETGDTPMLCVLNPQALSIVKSMTPTDVEILSDHLCALDLAGELSPFGHEERGSVDALRTLEAALARLVEPSGQHTGQHSFARPIG